MLRTGKLSRTGLTQCELGNAQHVFFVEDDIETLRMNALQARLIPFSERLVASAETNTCLYIMEASRQARLQLNLRMKWERGCGGGEADGIGPKTAVPCSLAWPGALGVQAVYCWAIGWRWGIDSPRSRWSRGFEGHARRTSGSHGWWGGDSLRGGEVGCPRSLVGRWAGAASSCMRDACGRDS